ncbi:fungal-specific transcription factor domain-containing protein [Zopfochytrium polystomum]|nr:fungal-specific transcription factor domain-containing protein [Zopfochytrium polystomum]
MATAAAGTTASASPLSTPMAFSSPSSSAQDRPVAEMEHPALVPLSSHSVQRDPLPVLFSNAVAFLRPPAVRKPSSVIPACDACNRKKVKCDNASPGWDSCTHARIQKKRGPRPGYISALETRLRTMENALELARSASTPSLSSSAPVPSLMAKRSLASTSGSNSSWKPDPDHCDTPFSIVGAADLSMNTWRFMNKDLPSSSARPPPSHVSVAFDDLSHYSNALHAKLSKDTSLSDLISAASREGTVSPRRHSLGGSPMTPFAQSESGFSARSSSSTESPLAQLMNTSMRVAFVGDRSTDSSHVLPAPSPLVVPLPVESNSPTDLSGALPDPPSVRITRALVNEIMEAYRRFVYSYMPVIHMSSFLQNIDHTPRLLVYAMCAVAARYTETETRRREWIRQWQACKAGCDGGWTEKRVQEAGLLTTRELVSEFMNVPKMETVSALVHLGIHAAASARGSAAWMYSGMATRMALDLRLNLEVPEESLSHIEREQRRRLWWACFTLDRVGGALSEHAMVIKESDCLCNLPNVADEWGEEYLELDEWTEKKRSPSPYTLMSSSSDFLPSIPPQPIPSANILLIKLFGRVIQFSHQHSRFLQTHSKTGHGAVDMEQAAQFEYRLASIDASLRTFWSSQPPWARECTAEVYVNSLSTSDPPSWYIPYLHLVFHSSLIMLHPWSRRTHVNPFSAVLQTASAVTCLNASKSSTDLLRRILKTNPKLRFMIPFCAYGVLQPALMHVILSQLTLAALQTDSLDPCLDNPEALHRLALAEAAIAERFGDAKVHVQALEGIAEDFFLMGRGRDVFKQILTSAESTAKRVLEKARARREEPSERESETRDEEAEMDSDFGNLSEGTLSSEPFSGHGNLTSRRQTTSPSQRVIREPSSTRRARAASRAPALASSRTFSSLVTPTTNSVSVTPPNSLTPVTPLLKLESTDLESPSFFPSHQNYALTAPPQAVSVSGSFDSAHQIPSVVPSHGPHAVQPSLSSADDRNTQSHLFSNAPQAAAPAEDMFSAMSAALDMELAFGLEFGIGGLGEGISMLGGMGSSSVPPSNDGKAVSLSAWLAADFDETHLANGNRGGVELFGMPLPSGGAAQRYGMHEGVAGDAELLFSITGSGGGPSASGSAESSEGGVPGMDASLGSTVSEPPDLAAVTSQAEAWFEAFAKGQMML